MGLKSWIKKRAYNYGYNKAKKNAESKKSSGGVTTVSGGTPFKAPSSNTKSGGGSSSGGKISNTKTKSSSGGGGGSKNTNYYVDIDTGEQYTREGVKGELKESEQPIEVRDYNPRSSTGGRIKSGGSQPQEIGMPVLTQEEAKKTTIPGYVVNPNNPNGQIEEMKRGVFVGTNTPPSMDRAINTRSLYQQNVKQIEATGLYYDRATSITKDFQANPGNYKNKPGVAISYDTEGNQFASLTPGYFENNINMGGINQQALINADTRFSNLPQGTRTKLNVAGFGQGVSSSVIGFAEFAVNSAPKNVQTETGDFSDVKPFKFGGTLGDIRSYPKTEYQNKANFLDNPAKWAYQGTIGSPERLGTTTTIAPVIWSGVRGVVGNYKAYGAKEGSIETLAQFSPIKMRGGQYFAPETTPEIVSFKTGNGRVYGGTKNPGLTIDGKPSNTGILGKEVIAPNGVTSGVVQTTTPYINIRGGGAIWEQGIATNIKPYVVLPGGKGEVATGLGGTGRLGQYQQLPGLQGQTGGVIYSGGVTTYVQPRAVNIVDNSKLFGVLPSGTASQNVISGVTAFRSGATYAPGANEVVTNKDYFIKTDNSFTGFNTGAQGVEFNINTLMGSGAGSSSGSGGLRTIKTSTTPFVPPTTLTPPTTTTGFNTVVPITSINKISAPKLEAPQFTGGLQQLPYNKGTLKPPVVDVLQSGLISVGDLTLDTQQRKRGGGSRAPQINQLIQIPVVKVKEEQTFKQIQDIKVGQIEGSKQRSVSALISQNGFNFYGGGYNPTPNVPIPVIPFPMGFGGGGFRGLGRVKTQFTERAYTPSFSALVYGVKGKQPKKVSRTGLNFRPITSKAFKVKRFRL